MSRKDLIDDLEIDIDVDEDGTISGAEGLVALYESVEDATVTEDDDIAVLGEEGTISELDDVSVLGEEGTISALDAVEFEEGTVSVLDALTPNVPQQPVAEFEEPGTVSALDALSQDAEEEGTINMIDALPGIGEENTISALDPPQTSIANDDEGTINMIDAVPGIGEADTVPPGLEEMTVSELEAIPVIDDPGEDTMSALDDPLSFDLDPPTALAMSPQSSPRDVPLNWDQDPPTALQATPSKPLPQQEEPQDQIANMIEDMIREPSSPKLSPLKEPAAIDVGGDMIREPTLPPDIAPSPTPPEIEPPSAAEIMPLSYVEDDKVEPARPPEMLPFTPIVPRRPTGDLEPPPPEIRQPVVAPIEPVSVRPHSFRRATPIPIPEPVDIGVEAANLAQDLLRKNEPYSVSGAQINTNWTTPKKVVAAFFVVLVLTALVVMQLYGVDLLDHFRKLLNP